MTTIRIVAQKCSHAVIALSAVLAALALPSPAAAEPSLDELRANLDKAGKELTLVVEKYNDARETLKDIEALVDKLDKELAPLRERVGALHEETDRFVVAVYKGGHVGALNAMLSAGSPQTLVEQIATLNLIADKRNKQIRALNDARKDLDVKKADIETLLDRQKKLATDLAAQRKTLERDIATLKLTYERVLATKRPPPPRQDHGDPPYVGGKAQAVVNYVYAQLGDPYVFGTAGPNAFDCSGLVLAAYRKVGVGLPHSSRRQYNVTIRVSRGALKPGDLVFFYNDRHHVGIYIGRNIVIHAPQPGEYVEKIGINAMPYAGAGRPDY